MYTFKPFNQLKFKTLIFDLGNVIIDVDFQKTIDFLKKYEPVETDGIPFYHSFLKNGFLELLETGHLSMDNYFDQIRRILKKKINEQEIHSAWNAMLLGIPKPRIDLLKLLRIDYKLILLTNTNQLHVEMINDYLYAQFKMQNFRSIFDKTYYSYLMGLRKPDAAIYKLVIQENNLNPSETLFIDDLPINIEEANKLGIQGYILKKGIDITELFENIIA
jgi:putative hydrolase of the HAD superfamily